MKLSALTKQRLEMFDQHVEHMIGAIRLCFSSGYIIPAMMLTFAGMAGMAWLYRKHNNLNIRRDFIDWVDTFMIAHLTSGQVTGTDFYATRCALLHERSSQSQLSRNRKARPFLFADRNGNIPIPHKTKWRKMRKPPILLDGQSVIDAFEQAIAKFRADIESSRRSRLILARCQEWFNYK